MMSKGFDDEACSLGGYHAGTLYKLLVTALATPLFSTAHGMPHIHPGWW